MLGAVQYTQITTIPATKSLLPKRQVGEWDTQRLEISYMAFRLPTYSMVMDTNGGTWLAPLLINLHLLDNREEVGFVQRLCV